MPAARPKTAMSEKPEIGEPAEEGGSVPIRRHSIFVAVGALISQPKKKLVLIGGASVLVLLGLIAVAIVAVPPAPKAKSQPIPAPIVPAPVLRELGKEVGKKSGVEERFEAIRRGDFASIQANRKRQETATNAPMEAARDAVGRSEPLPELSRSPSETRGQGKDATLAENVGKEVASGAESAVSPAKAKSLDPTTGGCDVGASDPKASAAAILACILEFNAMDLRERPGKPQMKKTPEK